MGNGESCAERRAELDHQPQHIHSTGAPHWIANSGSVIRLAGFILDVFPIHLLECHLHWRRPLKRPSLSRSLFLMHNLRKSCSGPRNVSTKTLFFPSISTFRLQPVDTAEKFGQNSNLTGVDFGEDGGWQFFKVVLRYSSSVFLIWEDFPKWISFLPPRFLFSPWLPASADSR